MQSDLHNELDHRTQGTQVEIEEIETPAITTQRSLEVRIAKVTDDGLEGFEAARREIKTQLAQVEARAERGFCQRTGTGADIDP
jgi:hypothetical protein